jgi:hypothetical protein
MFFEDRVYRETIVSQGEGVLIAQGVLHFVQNLNKWGASTFLQIFDHPAAGAFFVAPALVAMPSDITNSAFNAPFPTKDTGIIFKNKACTW